jgi:hypothetical protein
MTDKSMEITTYTQKDALEDAFKQGALEALSNGTPYMVDAIPTNFCQDTGKVKFLPVFCGKPFGDGVSFSVVGMTVTRYNFDDMIGNYRTKFQKTDMGCNRIFTVSLNAGGPGNHFCEGLKWHEDAGDWFDVERPRFSLFLTRVGDHECLFSYFKLKWNPISNCWKVIIIRSPNPLTPLLCRKTRETGRNGRTLSEENPRPFNRWECRMNPNKCGCSSCNLQRDDTVIGRSWLQTIVVNSPDCDCFDDEEHDGDCDCDCHRNCDCNHDCNNPFPCECYCHSNSDGDDEASDGDDEVSDGDDEVSDGEAPTSYIMNSVMGPEGKWVIVMTNSSLPLPVAPFKDTGYGFSCPDYHNLVKCSAQMIGTKTSGTKPLSLRLTSRMFDAPIVIQVKFDHSVLDMLIDEGTEVLFPLPNQKPIDCGIIMHHDEKGLVNS